MNTESFRIAAQLRHAFAGDPWHGPPLSELLASVTSEEALARPIPDAHNIRELVFHIDLWVRAAFDATRGIPMPSLYGTGKDFRVPDEIGAAAWSAAKARLLEGGDQLARAIESFSDARLQEIVPGREYDFYTLFHGIVQHSLYHGGQIAILTKAIRSPAA